MNTQQAVMIEKKVCLNECSVGMRICSCCSSNESELMDAPRYLFVPFLAKGVNCTVFDMYVEVLP